MSKKRQKRPNCSLAKKGQFWEAVDLPHRWAFSGLAKNQSGLKRDFWKMDPISKRLKKDDLSQIFYHSTQATASTVSNEKKIFSDRLIFSRPSASLASRRVGFWLRFYAAEYFCQLAKGAWVSPTAKLWHFPAVIYGIVLHAQQRECSQIPWLVPSLD